MSIFPGPYGQSPFDDFIARYLGGAPGQRPRRIDITALLTEQARELVSAAARHAAGRGSPDLDTEHLLWAMTEDATTPRLLSRPALDPAARRRRRDGAPPRGEPHTQMPALTPAAKRALLDAHQISRALGST